MSYRTDDELERMAKAICATLLAGIACMLLVLWLAP